MMTFYHIQVNDLRPILNSLSRLNTTPSENNLVITFNTPGLNCTWHHTSPNTCSLKVTGYLDGKSAAVNVEKQQDVLTVFENKTGVAAAVVVKHYDQTGTVKEGLLLQDVYRLGDVDASSVDIHLKVNHLDNVYGPDGHHVNHWFPSGERIYLNDVVYSVHRGDICAIDGIDGRIDGDRIIKYTKIRKEYQKNGSLKEKFIGVCFKQTLQESIIVMRNGPLVVNGLSLRRLPEKTKIHFGNFDVFTIKTLMDSLVGGEVNNTSRRQNLHKRSASKNNFEIIYGTYKDLQHSTISLTEDQNVSKTSTSIESQSAKVATYYNNLSGTVSLSANTLRGDDWQIDGLEKDDTNGATSLGSSSINKIINWVKDTSGWIVSRVLDTYRAEPSSGANYELPSGDILSNSLPSYSAALSHFQLNETIALVDFLVRIFTKVRGPRLSSTQTSMTLFEAQVYALKLASAFDELLEQNSHSWNIPRADMEFNPVTLQTRLVSVITKG